MDPAVQLLIGAPGVSFSLLPVGLTLGTLLPLYYFLKMMQETFESLQEENRLLVPGQVWFVLIPGFGLVWNFIVISKLADSLKLEFDGRGIPYSEERPGYMTGLISAIFYCGVFIPFVCYFAIPGWIIFLIIFWSRVDAYKREIQSQRKSD